MGRPFSFAPRGVVFHHTASNRNSGPAPALAICVNGRSDLPGPLCNVMIGRDGTVYVIAAGRANHAGLGGPWRSIPKDSGNAYTVGVEVENDGVGEQWSQELLRVCDRVFATLLVGLRHSESWLFGHKEWAAARGKIDPARIDMGQYRRRVRGTIRKMADQEKAKGSAKPEKAKGAAKPARPKPGEAEEKPTAAGTYVVEPGDTLWSIAQRHGLKVAQLKGANDLEDDLIRPGQRLKVTVPAGPRGEEPGEAAAKPEKRPAASTVHVVEAGETLWRIATKYGMTVKQVMELNELEGDVIHPGDELKVTPANP
jgi:LysM repeat protein